MSTGALFNESGCVRIDIHFMALTSKQNMKKMLKLNE